LARYLPEVPPSPFKGPLLQILARVLDGRALLAVVCHG
jgi:hypothetical protein